LDNWQDKGENLIHRYKYEKAIKLKKKNLIEEFLFP
jgi:hypothetical protein